MPTSLPRHPSTPRTEDALADLYLKALNPLLRVHSSRQPRLLQILSRKRKRAKK